jgi:hypothetical protein
VSFDVLIEMPLHQPSVALKERMSLDTTGTHMVLFHLELAPHGESPVFYVNVTSSYSVSIRTVTLKTCGEQQALHHSRRLLLSHGSKSEQICWSRGQVRHGCWPT